MTSTSLAEVRAALACGRMAELPEGTEFLSDDELDAELRAELSEFLTPRRALDGSLVWPIDELGGGQ